MPSLGQDNIKIFNSIVVPENPNGSTTGGLFLSPEDGAPDVTGQILVAANSYGKLEWSSIDVAISLGDLSDVTLTNPVANQVLTYNGTIWVNSFAGVPDSLENLVDVDVTPPQDGFSLTFNGGTMLWEQVLKEDYLGLPAVNGQFLSSTVAGVRSWTNAPTGAVLSVNGKTGVVVLNKADIGLGQVDNTSDLDKPISNATQAALDLKEDYLGLPASNGDVLTSTTGGVRSWTTITTSTPGGADTTVQYNDSGTFGGISLWTTNGTDTFSGGDTAQLTLGNSGEFSMTHDGSDTYLTNTIGDLFIGNDFATGDIVFILGDTAGATNFLVQNSSNATGFQMDSFGICYLGTSTLSAGPNTDGSVMQSRGQLFTDDTTAGSGTAPAHVFSGFLRPTLSATNASVTTTNAATVYIEDSPTPGVNQTLTNSWALWVETGDILCGGDVYADSFNASSDIRLKRDIRPLLGSLDILKHINGYSYNFKDYEDDSPKGKRDWGLIAQELDNVPALKHLVNQKGEFMSINYLGLIPLIIESIKELSNKLTN